MKIRHAELKDLDELSSIEKESYPPLEGAGYDSIKGRLKYFSDHFWVLENDDGKIVSFINGFVTNEKNLLDEMYDHPEMHDSSGKWQMIFSVVTAPDERRKGYASAVMAKVIEDAKKEGRDGIVLTCKDKLIKFYSKFGFKNEGFLGSTHGNVTWNQMRLTF